MERIIKQCFLCGKLAKNVKRFLSDKINEDKIYFTMKNFLEAKMGKYTFSGPYNTCVYI